MGSQFELKDPKRAQGFLLLFNHKPARQGEACFHEGHVTEVLCVEPGTHYRAQVQGNIPYRVDLEFNDVGGWEGTCSCPDEDYCKHVYAAMKGLLAEHHDAEVQALSSGAKQPVVRFVKPKPSPPPAKVPEPSLGDQVRGSLGRPLRPAEATFLGNLTKIYQHCQQTRTITAWHFAELGIRLGGYSWDPLKIWPVFPENLHTFWLYIAEAARERRLPIPEFMLPVTNLTAIQERMALWRRQRDIGLWKQTLEHSQLIPATASNPLAEELDLRLRVTEKKCVLEWKRTGMEAYLPASAKQARQFFDQYQNDLIAFTPTAEMLWQIYQPRVQWGYGAEFALTDLEGLKTLGRLFRRRLLEDRLVTEPGLPFLRAAEPLRWSLTPALDAAGDYRLRLTQADGAAPPPFLFVNDGAPPLYVTRDTVFTGPPVTRQVLDPTRENIIPAPALETLAGVQFLEQLRVEPPPRIRSRIRRVPMRIVIQAQLRSPYPQVRTEYLVLRVAAASEDGKLAENWDGYSWTKISPPVPQPTARDGADDALVFYDRSPLGEVPPLLEPLQLLFDPALGGLATRVTKKFPEVFSAWLRTVPPHIQVGLAGDLASLSLDTIAGRVRLDVTEAEIDWFDLKVVVDVSDTELGPEEIKLLLNAKGAFVRLEGKGWRRMEFELTGEEDERLARLGLNPHELTAEPQRLHALQLADEAAKKFLPAEQAEKIQMRAGEIKARVTPPLPAGLLAELRPYQVEGFHFLAYLATNRFGGILADDMGLGKTLQALAWLLWLREQPENAGRPTLVVCPKSVMDNWKAEAVRFAPSLRVRAWAPGALEKLPEQTGDAEVHVLNYSQLRLLGETLVPIRWLAVILDEGQYIKNPNSQTAQVARALHASHRLVLSGTPIENRLMDLWSLMAFTMPGVLGSRLAFGRMFDAKNDGLARRRLAARVRPFLLRRTKSQVAKDLPDKIEEDLFCEIEGEQKTLYRAELKFAQQLLLKIQTQKQLAQEQFNFLASLLRLRQICCHPALVKPDSKAESAKVNALLEQLEPLMEEGEKVLVFSQFVALLDLLRPVLEAKGWPLFYLTGATENRGQLVQDFQTCEGPAIFLISLKAGGFGLNLTAASYVMLFDPWWNPAVENQAIDRTHRIGQVNKVIAYRLLIKNSVEEKIRSLQKSKSALADDVLGEEKFAQNLTLDDLKFLLDDA